MTLEDAVDVFFEKSLAEGRMPFNAIPSKYYKNTITSINDAKNIIPGKAESKTYGSAKELYDKRKF